MRIVVGPVVLDTFIRWAREVADKHFVTGVEMRVTESDLNNQVLIRTLTSDGSNIADWAKMTTQTFNSPSGPFQVHFYQNLKTDAAYFGDDFKSVFNHNGAWP